GVRHVFITDNKLVDDVYELPEGWIVKVENQAAVEQGAVLAEKDDEVMAARQAGRVSLNGDLRVVWESKDERDYAIPAGMRILVSDGETVDAGAALTEGSLNPHRILEILGADAVTQYLLREVQKVYRPQGQNIHDKHFEAIIRKMLSKVMITTSGDTEMLPGDLVEVAVFLERNAEIVDEGGEPAQAEQVLLGITKAALNTDSFLSASSFQHTIKVLAGAAIAGKKDKLHGLKENVIIGKLIPAGTGYGVTPEEPEAEEELDVLAEGDDVETAVDLTTTLIDDDTDDEILAAIAAAAADAKKATEESDVTEEVETVEPAEAVETAEPAEAVETAESAEAVETAEIPEAIEAAEPAEAEAD
ncbi:MAG: DNA-directed RNA polymerase subunit beta', partial [Chloroflexi bacterium]|nr:DNA-directed RNA polymerase subunit beta' [Chloroflexota bacterium]